jgi:hypothetical protein
LPICALPQGICAATTDDAGAAEVRAICEYEVVVVSGRRATDEWVGICAGGDGIACGTSNDALEIISNSAADTCCRPVVVGAVVGGRNSCVAVAVVEGVVFGAKGDGTGDRTSVVEVEGIVQFAKVEVDGTTS